MVGPLNKKVMKNKNSYRIAGIAGILSAVLYLLSIIGLQTYISVDLQDTNNFVLNIVESHNMMLVYGWPGLFATILILPLSNILAQEAKRQFIAKQLIQLVIIGLSFILVAYMFHLAFIYFFAPTFINLKSVDQTMFGIVFKNMVGLQDIFWLVGDFIAFLGIALLMSLNLSSDVFPKWLLYGGIIACFVASLGSLSFIPSFKTIPGLSFMFIAGFSGFTVWELIASVYLIKFKNLI